MTNDQPMSPAEYHAMTNAEIDFNDPAIAWNFGTRELTTAEYEQFAAAHHADLDRWYADQERAAEYHRWAQAHPEEHVARMAPVRDVPWAEEEPRPAPQPEPEAG
jgi:hypothetical protein